MLKENYTVEKFVCDILHSYNQILSVNELS